MQRRGYTIYEVLIIIAILGIIATITFPFYRQYIELYQLSTETRRLVLVLRRAQQATVTEQIPYYVKIFPGTNEYQYLSLANPMQPPVVLETIELGTTTTISLVAGFTDDEIHFTPAGGAVETGTIMVRHTNGKEQTIEVKPSGFITSS